MASQATVPVYEWLTADGTGVGCGTEVEFRYWQAEGVVETDSQLGKIITHEPASEDERRKAAWAVSA